MASSAPKPLKLHAHASGPNPIKLAIALEFLAVPYTIHMWDFSDSASSGVKGSTFLAINPNGRVPALEDPNTGVTAWESGAILNYVRRVYDKEGKLGPQDDSEQARVDLEKWECFLLTTLGPMTGQVNWFRHYHSSKNADALERYEKQTYRCYEVLEGQLAGNGGGDGILGGNGVSVVDVQFEPWVRQHEFAGLSLQKFPKVKAWLDGMKERKEVVEAYRRLKEAGDAA